MLKAELHTHINKDPQDNHINYSAYELIDACIRQGFDVVAITCHDFLFYDKKVEDYAKKKGIILFFGIEKNIEGGHTLIYNCPKEIEKVHTFKDLIKYKRKHPETLIIASHPFFWICSHKKNILKYLELFDAWEYSYFYVNPINPNKKVQELSREFNKPLVGNSDVHNLKHLGLTYSLIDAKKDRKSIIDSIKKGRVNIVTRPFKIISYVVLSIKMVFRTIIIMLKKK